MQAPDPNANVLGQNKYTFGGQGKSGPDINKFIQENPDVLTEYWDQNPDALAGAIDDNPDAFGVSHQNQAYQGYTDKAFENAMRTLEPFHEQSMDKFEQSMINKGLDPSSQAYQDAHGNYMRGFNDMLNDAAFESLRFGADRYDTDRGFRLAQDQFDLNELSTIDSMNRAWDNIAFRNAGYADSRLDQQFNQLMSMFGFTPVGSTTPVNVNSAAGYNSQLNAYNQNQNMWNTVGQFAQDAAANVDWGDLFGNGGGDGGNWQNDYNIDWSTVWG